MVKIDWYQYFVDRCIFGFYIGCAPIDGAPGFQTSAPEHHRLYPKKRAAVLSRIRWTTNPMVLANDRPVPWHRCYLL